MSECNGRVGLGTEVIGDWKQGEDALKGKLSQCLDDRLERLAEPKTTESLNPNGDGSIYREGSKTAGKICNHETAGEGPQSARPRLKDWPISRLYAACRRVRRHFSKHADTRKARAHLKKLSDFMRQELGKCKISPFRLCRSRTSECAEEVDRAEISSMEVKMQVEGSAKSGMNGREQTPPRNKSTTAVFMERVKRTPIKKYVIEAPSQLYNSDDWCLMKWLQLT